MSNALKWSLALAAGSVLIGTLSVSGVSADDLQSPSTQPTTQPETRGEHGKRLERGERAAGERGKDLREIRDARDRNGGFMQNRPPADYRSEELPGDEEWAEIVEFMRAKSPVRLEMYDKLVATYASTNWDRPVQSARRRIAGRYRDLVSMKERHPDMYEFALKQAVLEDQILGLMRDMRVAKDEDPMHAKFRDLVKSYVDNFLDEREARLKRLREMVEKETQTIRKDRDAIDDLVDKQSEKFEREMSRMLDFWENPEKFLPQSPGTP